MREGHDIVDDLFTVAHRRKDPLSGIYTLTIKYMQKRHHPFIFNVNNYLVDNCVNLLIYNLVKKHASQSFCFYSQPPVPNFELPAACSGSDMRPLRVP